MKKDKKKEKYIRYLVWINLVLFLFVIPLYFLMPLLGLGKPVIENVWHMALTGILLLVSLYGLYNFKKWGFYFYIFHIIVSWIGRIIFKLDFSGIIMDVIFIYLLYRWRDALK